MGALTGLHGWGGGSGGFYYSAYILFSGVITGYRQLPFRVFF